MDFAFLDGCLRYSADVVKVADLEVYLAATDGAGPAGCIAVEALADIRPLDFV